MRLLFAISAALALMTLPLVAATDETALDGSAPSANETSADLDRAARDYRITVYNTFRTERAEFDRRNAFWQAIYRRWQQDGEKTGEIPALVAWLEDASAVSRNGNVAALPSAPQFGLAKEPAIPVKPPRSVQPPRAVAKQPVTQQPSVKPPSVKQPSVKQPTGKPVPPGVAQSPLVEPKPAPAIEPTIPSLARRVPIPQATLPRAAASGDLPAVPLPISPTIADPPRATNGDASESLTLGDEPTRRPAPAATIEPQVVDPPPTPAEIADDIPDGIDVGEVAIRVAGHNLALATLVEDIRKAESPTIEELAAFVERLEGHAVRVQDLTPYYSLVNEAERSRLQPLAELGLAVDLLRERLTTLNVSITSDSALPESTRNEQLARVAELEHRLQQLASPAP